MFLDREAMMARMPSNEEEILTQFEDVLKKMDLPPDKLRVLRDYDISKKWELVCDQKKMHEAISPSVYLEKLAAYLDKKTLKKKKKLLGDETSTTILKHIEISLRTNSIDWVRSFLSEENHGLLILVEYLDQLQEAAIASQGAYDMSTMNSNGHGSSMNGDHEDRSSSSIFRKSKSKVAKNFGDPDDDIHVCVSCLRALMNNKGGFAMVFNNEQAVYGIVRSILHQSLRTKALALELLAAICMVQNGHERISAAFNRFKLEYSEPRRFQRLFNFFRYPPEFHVEFMKSTMQFFNIFVHSVDDMNYRAYLQYEFTLLGLDDYLEEMRSNESVELQEHRVAYLNNMIDIAVLTESAQQTHQLKMDNEEMVHRVSMANERLQVVEADYISRIAALDRRLKELSGERERLIKERDSVVDTLNRRLTEKEEAARERQSKLESRINELEQIHKSLSAGLQVTQGMPSGVSTAPPTPPPPPPGPHRAEISTIPPPPPPPPPPPMLMTGRTAPGNIPLPPPPPNLLSPPANDVMTIKRVIQTRNKLPQLNWTALKPNQVKDTVFNDLDDEKITDKIDFTALEDFFKVGSACSSAQSASIQSSTANGGHATSNKNKTLLDTKRLQNIAITRRKLAMLPNEILAAVHRFDLSALPAESVDILLRIAPSQEEIDTFRGHEAKHRGFESLSEEDHFMAQLVKIERLEHKLKIMSFMGSFDESADLIDPQLNNLTAASKCAREANLFHRVLEVILAYGNYMNSGRRGGVYGFKLASLDTLAVLKAPSDRSLTLLHLIADTVAKKFPELLKFPEQLKFIDKASAIVWETVLSDLKELDAGFELSRKEAQKSSDCPSTLSVFVEHCEPRMRKLQENARIASEAFNHCVEFYGESARSQQPSVFFTRLTAFVHHFQQAVADNSQRALIAKRTMEEAERREKLGEQKKKTGNNEQQEMLIDELSLRLADVNNSRASRKVDSSQIDHGDFEKIITGLKEGAYVTYDGAVPVPSRRSVNGRMGPPTAPKTSRLRK